MQVKAKRMGEFPQGKRRREGEVFDYTGPTKKTIKKDGKDVEVDYLPSWVVPVGEADQAEAKAKPAGDKGPKAGGKKDKEPAGDKGPKAGGGDNAQSLPGT